MVRGTVRMVMPSKKHREVLGILWSMAERAKAVPGCMSCRVYQDAKEDRVIMLEEVWNSEEGLERHIRSDEYRKLLLVMETALYPPEIRYETISGSSGVETIQKARSSL